MDLWSAPPIDVRGLLQSERAELIDLLLSLDCHEWLSDTRCGSWTVKDLALHLLDDDLGWLSRGRDKDTTSLIPMNGDYRAFVAALDHKNQTWLEASGGLSQRVVKDLLAWSSGEVGAYHQSMDLSGTTTVVWAGGQVPAWLGIGRDFTERWVHQKQIREALNRPGEHDRYLPAVLSIFIWAFPYQLRTPAETGTVINLDLGKPACWHLIRHHEDWELESGLAPSASATLATDMDVAWRLLTGAPYSDSNLVTTGPPSLTDPLLAVRGIIV